MDGAMRCFREALADDPEEETARTRLQILTTAKKKQVRMEWRLANVWGPEWQLEWNGDWTDC